MDAEDETLPEGDSFLQQLTRVRNMFANAKSDPNVGDLRETHAEARMLDSIVENAVYMRAVVEGLSERKRAALVKRVRKALGYTYP